MIFKKLPPNTPNAGCCQYFRLKSRHVYVCVSVCLCGLICNLFVVPKKGAERVPLVALLVNVAHAAAETGLELLGVVPEEVHDKCPTCRREDGPGIVGDGLGARRLGDDGQAVAGLDGDASQGEHHAGKDVDDDLLVDRRDLACPRGAAAEHEVAAQETGDEGVVCAWREVAVSWLQVTRRRITGEAIRSCSPSLPGVVPKCFRM